MQGRCQDLRCKSDKHIKQIYLHSANYYAPEKLLEPEKLVADTYYWACISCIEKDHRDFEENKDKYLKRYYATKLQKSNKNR